MSGVQWGIKRYATELDYLRALESAVFQVVPRECGCCENPPLDEALAKLAEAHASVWGPECDHIPVEPPVPSTRPDLVDAAHERAIARAYWRGMLAPLIAEADFAVARFEEKKARENLGWDVAINWNKRRAARLRTIADGPMWEPWWERRKAVGS